MARRSGSVGNFIADNSRQSGINYGSNIFPNQGPNQATLAAQIAALQSPMPDNRTDKGQAEEAARAQRAANFQNQFLANQAANPNNKTGQYGNMPDPAGYVDPNSPQASPAYAEYQAALNKQSPQKAQTNSTPPAVTTKNSDVSVTEHPGDMSTYYMPTAPATVSYPGRPDAEQPSNIDWGKEVGKPNPANDINVSQTPPDLSDSQLKAALDAHGVQYDSPQAAPSDSAQAASYDNSPAPWAAENSPGPWNAENSTPAPWTQQDAHTSQEDAGMANPPGSKADSPAALGDEAADPSSLGDPGAPPAQVTYGSPDNQQTASPAQTQAALSSPYGDTTPHFQFVDNQNQIINSKSGDVVYDAKQGGDQTPGRDGEMTRGPDASSFAASQLSSFNGGDGGISGRGGSVSDGGLSLGNFGFTSQSSGGVSFAGVGGAYGPGSDAGGMSSSTGNGAGGDSGGESGGGSTGGGMGGSGGGGSSGGGGGGDGGGSGGGGGGGE